MTETRAATTAPRPATPARRSGERARGLLVSTGLVGLSLAAFLLLWQLVVWVSGFRSFILPGPYTVAERFVRAWAEGTMWPHVQQTLIGVLLTRR